jgi:8-oxo-dGTP diphosphatase
VALLGASCHHRGDLEAAGAVGADLVVLGPVAPTASHPQATPLGWDGFGREIELTPAPVYALGGVGRDDLETATRRGAHGIAAQRAVWLAAG